MRAVDTNVVVRLLTRDDPRQTARAEAFVSKGAWVSHIVLVEVIGVLDSVFELTQKQLATAVDMLLNHRDLVLQDPEIVTAALARFRRRPKLESLIAWCSSRHARPGTSRWPHSTRS